MIFIQHTFSVLSNLSLFSPEEEKNSDKSAASSPCSFPSDVSQRSEGAADLWLPRLAVTNLIQQIIAEYEVLSGGQPRCLDLLPRFSG